MKRVNVAKSETLVSKKSKQSKRYPKKKMHSGSVTKRGQPFTFYLPRSLTGVPERYFTNIAYATTIIPTAAISEYYYTLTGNGLYDPDITGVGRQPQYFDELMALYTNYRVWDSKIEVTFVNRSTTEPFSVVVIPTVTSGAILALNDEEFQQQPYAVSDIVSIAGGQDILRMRNSMSTSKIWGIPNIIYGSFNGTSSANPSDLWYWVVNVNNMDDSGSIASGSCILEMVVTYRAEFFNHTTIDGS